MNAMGIRIRLVLLTGAALLLVACGSNNASAPPAQQTTTTLSALVHSIFTKDTTETAKPRDINNLKVDTTSQDPNAYDDLLSAAGH